MRYCIISDIEGNITALEAILQHASTQHIDQYLFLGDMIGAYAANDKVLAQIINLSAQYPTIALQGQNEKDLLAQTPASTATTAEQQQITYTPLQPLHLQFIQDLPTTAEIADTHGQLIYLQHHSDLFFRASPAIDLFHPLNYRAIMTKSPFSYAEYLLFARGQFLSTPGTLDLLLTTPGGIYLFGKNHLQFNMEYDHHAFINPGSGGAPLDWNPSAAYTILETLPQSKYNIQDHRIPYNHDTVAQTMDISGFTQAAPMLAKLYKMQGAHARDYVTSFMLHVQDVAKKHNQPYNPAPDHIWREASDTYDTRRIGGVVKGRD